jgi:hypothetical protein
MLVIVQFHPKCMVVTTAKLELILTLLQLADTHGKIPVPLVWTPITATPRQCAADRHRTDSRSVYRCGKFHGNHGHRHVLDCWKGLTDLCTGGPPVAPTLRHKQSTERAGLYKYVCPSLYCQQDGASLVRKQPTT